jgi:hypothetical protein
MWEFIGWEGLTPNEQSAAVAGMMIALGSVLARRVLFSGHGLRRREPSRRIRHRPAPRPASPKKRRKRGKPKPKGRR